MLRSLRTQAQLALAAAMLLAARALPAADDPRAALRLLVPRALGAEREITVSAQALEAGVATLALRLDGRELGRGRSPRLDLAAPLEWPPRPQILEAEALDAQGCPVELELAFLRHPARVFPVELRVTGVGCDEQGPWARLFAQPPPGSELAEVVLWAGTRRVGAARELPALFRLTGRDLAEPFLRGEVVLADGRRAEATRLFDRERFGAVVDVRRGEARRLLPEPPRRPAQLAPERVSARWRGTPQRIVSVELGSALPLALAIAVDASPSTLAFRDRVLELATETASALAPQGPAAGEPPILVLFSESAVVTFADGPPERTAALADRLPFGRTALFDALAIGLHENASGGRRAALLAVTDGCDTASSTGAGEVGALAQALGVPIYALVFDAEPCFERARADHETASAPEVVRSPGWGSTRVALRDLCRASGGELYRIGGREDLSTVWRGILADLERQVVIVYEPSAAEVDPAEVEIEIAPPKRRGLFRR